MPEYSIGDSIRELQIRGLGAEQEKVHGLDNVAQVCFPEKGESLSAGSILRLYALDVPNPILYIAKHTPFEEKIFLKKAGEVLPEMPEKISSITIGYNPASHFSPDLIEMFPTDSVVDHATGLIEVGTEETGYEEMSINYVLTSDKDALDIRVVGPSQETIKKLVPNVLEKNEDYVLEELRVIPIVLSEEPYAESGIKRIFLSISRLDENPGFFEEKILKGLPLSNEFSINIPHGNFKFVHYPEIIGPVLEANRTFKKGATIEDIADVTQRYAEVLYEFSVRVKQ